MAITQKRFKTLLNRRVLHIAGSTKAKTRQVAKNLMDHVEELAAHGEAEPLEKVTEKDLPPIKNVEFFKREGPANWVLIGAWWKTTKDFKVFMYRSRRT